MAPSAASMGEHPVAAPVQAGEATSWEATPTEAVVAPRMDAQKQPLELQASAAPTREAFAERGAAVLATGAPKLAGVQFLNGSADPCAPIPLNTRAIDFETNLFAGRLLISARGAPGDAAAGRPGGPLAAPSAAAPRRMFHVAVQGRFKREVLASDMVSGQELPKPPRLPPSMMSWILTGAAKVFASTVDVVCEEGKPQHFLFPVLAAAQLINVSRPGEEPDLLDAPEDMTLWDKKLTGRSGGPMGAAKRQRFFDVPANLAGRTIGTEHVWTLHIWQSLIDFSTYKLGLPGVPVAIDLIPMLDAQPLQIMAKHKASGDYAFCVLMWCERMLQAQPGDGGAAAAEQLTAAGKLRDRVKGMFSGWA